MEKWKKIRRGAYELSSLGRVRNTNGRLLKPQMSLFNERCSYVFSDQVKKAHIEVTALMSKKWPHVHGPFGYDWQKRVIRMNKDENALLRLVKTPCRTAPVIPDEPLRAFMWYDRF